MAPGTRSSKEPTKNGKSENNKTEDGKQKSKLDNKENATQQPLAPPPRPQQSEGDYFSQSHQSNNPSYQAEPNPFEAQFGSTSAGTPGKLPSIAALTSPNTMLPNDTPGWSLRSGPLSPAMLTGPTGPGDYFDNQYPKSFPTPNESSLRTGLTPGGGGSMFPAASPGLFGMNFGAPTPNTVDFFKTASARATAMSNASSLAPTSQPHDASSKRMNLKLPSITSADTLNHPDADAANGLFMLAQSNGARSSNQYALPPPTLNNNIINNNNNGTTITGGAVQQPTAPIENGRSSRKTSKNSLPPSIRIEAEEQKYNAGDDDDNDDQDLNSSDEDTMIKPARRTRRKRNSEPIRPSTRRKASTEATKGTSKRQKAIIDQVGDVDDDDDDEGDLSPKDTKKMTDEEKRKNFLERNRVAALKCRQRKKQWLQNLQSKVDIYTSENENLTAKVQALQAENSILKQTLLQHKDCPVTLSHHMGQAHIMSLITGDPAMMQQQAQHYHHHMPSVSAAPMGMTLELDSRTSMNGNGTMQRA